MEGGVEELSIEVLASNLSTYKEQLEQVRQLLSEDPRNLEYADMEKELKEVIALTEELLATAKQNEISLTDAGVSAGATAGSPDLESAWENMGSRNDPIHEGKFPVGTKVQAVFSDDGEWYDATIEAHTANGYFVAYDEWGNKEEVDPENVRPIEQNAIVEAERLAQATKNALKRKIEQAASSDYQTKTLPAKLKIDPNDPEDVKIAKRKKIHAFKSKARFEQLEVVQNKKQNDWQQFQTTKAKTKKVGFFTGRKKESIFKSPEDPFGKVGVTGSGKGLTDFQKREKHLHLKSGNSEGTDE
ncbi:nucleic acid binding protein [Arabidopsis lyrata subsp. lyrata]|uniref:Nucleic acid binding protein n=1 Tax=Arabidopsis lyrata subsp. lyrata TaxID=81972 RepID=D7LQ48_ARALL|nr:survival of motor neuron-related-splicing factor 30 [Arabidopsis lyrata subsp. lyrata]EFH53083.1 nucleic acid binding protein [Arabidopsis lyrata subsp. lyrata]|eukprot:XP_002876824.1 survival of motor neuron-related-splicing factor 30 [Arabidopsis lyrata subsp. lyrata]